MEAAKANVGCTLSIKVIRADGTVEDLGVVGEAKPSLVQKLLKKVEGK